MSVFVLSPYVSTGYLRTVEKTGVSRVSLMVRDHPEGSGLSSVSYRVQEIPLDPRVPHLPRGLELFRLPYVIRPGPFPRSSVSPAFGQSKPPLLGSTPRDRTRRTSSSQTSLDIRESGTVQDHGLLGEASTTERVSSPLFSVALRLQNRPVRTHHSGVQVGTLTFPSSLLDVLDDRNLH